MAHYCDTRLLEQSWFNWIVASATPLLEEYRKSKLLLTKVISNVPRTTTQRSNTFWGLPNLPKRAHCIAIDRPIYFNSYNGKHDKPRYFDNDKPIVCGLPLSTEKPNQDIIDRLLTKGYTIEIPTKISWDIVLINIQKICSGIAFKFNLNSDEAYNDLASEAFIQVTNKIKTFRLIFTPGLAPVFNLLTTSVYRIMFSILNKNNKENNNKAEYLKLILPIAARGQTKSHGRVITQRVFGSLVSNPTH